MPSELPRLRASRMAPRILDRIRRGLGGGDPAPANEAARAHWPTIIESLRQAQEGGEDPGGTTRLRCCAPEAVIQSLWEASGPRSARPRSTSPKAARAAGPDRLQCNSLGVTSAGVPIEPAPAGESNSGWLYCRAHPGRPSWPEAGTQTPCGSWAVRTAGDPLGQPSAAKR